MEEAENICDKVIMINKGKIIKTGTPEEIKKDTKTKKQGEKTNERIRFKR